MALQTIKNEALRYATTLSRITVGKGVVKEPYMRWKLKQVLSGKRDVRKPEEHLHNVVLSLTSWHARIDILPLTLLTLVEQSARPAAIEVWMTEEDLRLIPARVHKTFSSLGVSFRPSEDYRSHKKWLNALQERSDHFIVTADDDIIYPRHWLRWLMNDHRSTKRVSVAHRCHRIVFDASGGVAPYAEWKKDVPAYGEVSPSLFATGCGGQVLHQDWLPPEALEPDRILAICPNSDDIWLACALASAGVPRMRSHTYFPLLEAEGSYNASLQQYNDQTGYKNEQLQATMEAFGVGPEHFQE